MSEQKPPHVHIGCVSIALGIFILWNMGRLMDLLEALVK